MSVTGRVTNGVVVLPPGTAFPEGAEVKVEPLNGGTADDPFVAAVERIVKQRGDREAKSGIASLPDDLAVNHDYYLHGHSRKAEPRSGRWIAPVELVRELSEQQAADDAKQLASMVAETSGLPADLSTNHDHYLHGLPKQ